MKLKPIARLLCLIGGSLAVAAAVPSPVLAEGVVATPPVRHVFIVILENEGYQVTFGEHSQASYLKQLARQGALLQNYYGIGHFSLDNYIAMVSGQAPNSDTQSDCTTFTDFVETNSTPAPDGQLAGSGCIYPRTVDTLAGQLERRGLTWKAYMEDMGNNLARDKTAACAHPVIGQLDETERAVSDDQYATRHNPFMYFHSIIDQASCAAHVVNLAKFDADLRSIDSTANYSFISPNLCHDGHDGGEGKSCVNGEPGGLVSADHFLSQLVPRILSSAAFKRDGLLIVTFDEADVDIKTDPITRKWVVSGDASACCHELPGPNLRDGILILQGIPDRGPGIFGPGGGRIGAVLISPFIKPGTVSKAPYNHYALLRSIEDLFGLDHLGLAGQDGLRSFDVYTRARVP